MNRSIRLTTTEEEALLRLGWYINEEYEMDLNTTDLIKFCIRHVYRSIPKQYHRNPLPNKSNKWD